MSSLPGLVACGFLMGRIGRINMLCGGLFTAMIFSLFLPLSLSAEAALLAILCLFAGKSYRMIHTWMISNGSEQVVSWTWTNWIKLDYLGLLVPAWSAIHVLTVESFPTDRRATALGIFIKLSRAGALLGKLISLFLSRDLRSLHNIFRVTLPRRNAIMGGCPSCQCRSSWCRNNGY